MRSEPIEVPHDSPQVNLLVSMNPTFLKGQDAPVLAQILPTFRSLGVTSVRLYFMAALKNNQMFTSFFPPEDLGELRFEEDFSATRIDWALVFGGDGALLWAHKALVAQPQVLYFSVKTGHLGVLTSFVMGDMPRLLKGMAATLRGHPGESGLCVKRYHRIRAAIVDEAGEVLNTFVAVNEIVLFRTTNYCPKFVLSCNGTRLMKFGADGLILCTPAGSTAYNSSVGGPTLMAHLPNYVLSAIAPFGVNFRPFVFGPDDVLSITTDPSSGSEEFKVIQDSNTEGMVHEGQSLQVSLEETPHLKLVGFVGNLQEEWSEKIRPIFKWDT